MKNFIFEKTEQMQPGISHTPDTSNAGQTDQANVRPTIAGANLPEWDIVPPAQFLNPRIKK